MDPDAANCSLLGIISATIPLFPIRPSNYLLLEHPLMQGWNHARDIIVFSKTPPINDLEEFVRQSESTIYLNQSHMTKEFVYMFYSSAAIPHGMCPL